MAPRSKRQNRRGASGMASAGGSAPFGNGQPGQPGQPGQVQPGQRNGQPGQPGVTWALGTPPTGPTFSSQQSISLPGGFPFWQPPSGQPGQPGQSAQSGQPGQPRQQPGSAGYVPPPRLQKHTKHESTARGPLPPGKRQRFQSVGGGSDVPQHPLAGPNPQAPPSGPPSFKPGQPLPGLVQPSSITPLIPFGSSVRPPWVLDSPARAHFPHSSLSFPLPSPGPRTSHFNKDSISYSSSKLGLGVPPSTRRVPSNPVDRVQGNHNRVGSGTQRVGPPPKAILGGPGGKTFDELQVTPTPTRATSLEVTPDPSRRSSFGANSVGSTDGSPRKAPSVMSANEPFEVKHMGNTVRVALPPEKYSPPDTPTVTQDDKEAEASAEDATPPPLRVSRKDAFPWPAPKVRVSPTSIPLPLSPVESEVDSVEASIPVAGDAPFKHNHSGSDPSLVPSWKGKEVVFSVPSQTRWQKARSMRVSIGDSPAKTEASIEAMDMDEVDEAVGESADMSGTEHSDHTSPFGSTTWATAFDESVPGMSTPAFTALQEPWPPTRSGTPSTTDRPQFSPIREDLEKEVDNESDTDTAIIPAAQKPSESLSEDPSTAASVPLPTNPPNTAATPGVDTPPSPPIPPNAATPPSSSPPQQTQPIVDSPHVPPNPPNTAVNEDEPPVTAIPLDTTVRFPGLDTDSAMPSPLRRTFGINPFLKRSLGGLLREDTRTSSASSSVDVSPAVSRRTSPATRPTALPDAEATSEDAASLKEAQNDSVNVGEEDILPGDLADDEDNAIEPAPKASVEVTQDEKSAGPENAEVKLTDATTEPTQSVDDTAKAVADVGRTDTDSLGKPADEPTTPATRSRRPTAVFANPAFRRQVQGFIRSDASAFQRTPMTATFPHREGEEASAPPTPATGAAVEPASPEAPAAMLDTASPIAASPEVTKRKAAVDNTELKNDNPEPAPFSASQPEPEEIPRPRSPLKDPTVTKKLKPTASIFKPTAPVFKPTAPVFKPGALWFDPTAPVFNPGIPVFNPGAPVFNPSASTFKPGAPVSNPGAVAFVPKLPTKTSVPRAEHVPTSVNIVPAVPLSLAASSSTPQSKALNPGSISVSPTKTPYALRPSALPFVPGGRVTFGSPAGDNQHSAGSDSGVGALGLFTFTHKLSDTEIKTVCELKPEYQPKPRMGPNGTPYRPPPLDLSRSEPASRAFELLETPFQSDHGDRHEPEQPGAAASLTRSYSYRDNSDLNRKKEFHNSESIDQGRRHSFKASADLKPWKARASPRSDCARSEGSASEVGFQEEGESEKRKSARCGKHTAKRSSQSSYLPRVMVSKSTPSSPLKSPTKESPASSAGRILRSRPLRARHSSGSSNRGHPWLSSTDETFGESRQTTSSQDYPIAPVPSDIDGMNDTMDPRGTLRDFVRGPETATSEDVNDLSRETFGVSDLTGIPTAGLTAGLNPAAQPFVFGAHQPVADGIFTPTPPREPLPSLPVRTTTPTPPSIQVELADENKFRKWIFPKGDDEVSSGPEPAPSRVGQHHSHKRSHSNMTADEGHDQADELQVISAKEFDGEASVSEVNEEEVEWRTWRKATDDNVTSESPHVPSSNTSAEFPMRSGPPRVLAVVNGNNDTTSQRALVPLWSEQPSTVGREDNTEILNALERIHQQLAALTLDTQSTAKDAERRAYDSHRQAAVATEALDLIKAYIPNKRAIDGITHVLETQGDILHEIHSKVDDEEERHHRSIVDSNTNAMIKAVLGSQNAMMDRFAEFSEAQEAIYELRSATDALLEARSDVRALRADRAQAVLQTQTLTDMQKALREETSKTTAAEKEIAALKTQLAEADHRALKIAQEQDRRQGQRERANQQAEDAWRNALRSEMEAATASLAEVVKSEQSAREEIVSLRELLAERAAAPAAVVGAGDRSSEAHKEERLAREELVAMRELLARQVEEQTVTIDTLRAERDAMALLAEERHTEATRMQTESIAFKQKILDRFDRFEASMHSQPAGKETENAKVASLEKEVETLRAQVSELSTVNTDLRVQLTQALADVKLEQEKAVRLGDEEAGSRRSLDLQLKGEKARSSFLENKVQKFESELHDLSQNLDVWRSAALEQRMRAEQSAVHLAALQQENYHWREFALGADRHRLESWLATKPFHNGADHAYGQTQAHGQRTPVQQASPTRTASRSVSAATAAEAAFPTPTHTPDAHHHSTGKPVRAQPGSPLKHAIRVPSIVVPQ